jgi:hypothetical protein
VVRFGKLGPALRSFHLARSDPLHEARQHNGCHERASWQSRSPASCS